MKMMLCSLRSAGWQESNEEALMRLGCTQLLLAAFAGRSTSICACLSKCCNALPGFAWAGIICRCKWAAISAHRWHAPTGCAGCVQLAWLPNMGIRGTVSSMWKTLCILCWSVQRILLSALSSLCFLPTHVYGLTQMHICGRFLIVTSKSN